MLKKNISSIFTIVAATAVVQLGYTIILGRFLPKTDMGIIKFIFSAVTLVGAIAILGQDTAITRFFSNNLLLAYNWKRWLKNILFVGSPIVILGTAIIYKFYRISRFHSICFVLVTISFLVIRGYSSIFRSQKYFKNAIIFKQMVFLVFAVVLMVGMVFFKAYTLDLVIIYYTLAGMLCVFYIFAYTSKKFDSGDKIVPKSAYIDGMLLFGTSISMVVLTTSDKFFIAKMLSFEQLAIYSVTFSIMCIFNFVAEALWFVMVPYFAKVDEIKFKKIGIYLSGVVLAISIFYLFYGAKLLNFFFAGKYNKGKYLIPFFIIIGIIRVFYQIPSSIISGRLKQKYLKIFLYMTIVFLILNLILNYYFINLWGLKGVVIATIVSWGFMFFGGSIVAIKGLNVKMSLKAQKGIVSDE